MTKSGRTSSVLVPFVLGAFGILVFFVAGCSKSEPAAAVPSHAPESYMNDKPFRQALVEKRQARNALGKVRSRLVKKLELKFEAKRLELGVACANGAALKRPLTEAEQTRIRAALEGDMEWKDLCQRCIDANEAMRDNQKATQRLVRERIAPKTGWGAGKTKDISK